MYIPKRYGESRVDSCPFCGMQATTVNAQDAPVCLKHKTTLLPDMKCACGEWLDIRKGKFGLYFHCMRCGNVSASKAFEMNDVKTKATPVKAEPAKSPQHNANDYGKKEFIVRSDDPRYFS